MLFVTFTFAAHFIEGLERFNHADDQGAAHIFFECAQNGNPRAAGYLAYMLRENPGIVQPTSPDDAFILEAIRNHPDFIPDHHPRGALFLRASLAYRNIRAILQSPDAPIEGAENEIGTLITLADESVPHAFVLLADLLKEYDAIWGVLHHIFSTIGQTCTKAKYQKTKEKRQEMMEKRQKQAKNSFVKSSKFWGIASKFFDDQTQQPEAERKKELITKLYKEAADYPDRQAMFRLEVKDLHPKLRHDRLFFETQHINQKDGIQELTLAEKYKAGKVPAKLYADTGRTEDNFASQWHLASCHLGRDITLMCSRYCDEGQVWSRPINGTESLQEVIKWNFMEALSGDVSRIILLAEYLAAYTPADEFKTVERLPSCRGPNLDEALRCSLYGLNRTPDDEQKAIIYKNLIRFCVQKGDNDSALQYCDEAASLQNVLSLIDTLGSDDMAMYEQALCIGRSALQVQTGPKRMEILNQLAKIAFNGHKREDTYAYALESFNESSNLDASVTLLALFNLRLHTQSNLIFDPELIERCMQTMISFGSDFDKILVANQYVVMNRVEEAIALFLQIPGSCQRDFQLGSAYEKLGNFEEALEYYQRAFEQIASTDDSVLKGGIYNNMGLMYESGVGEFAYDRPKILELYEQALRLNPNYLPYKYNVAVAKIRVNPNDPSIIPLLTEVAESGDEDAIIDFSRHIINRQMRQHYASALKFLETIQEKQEARLMKAVILINSNDLRNGFGILSDLMLENYPKADFIMQQLSDIYGLKQSFDGLYVRDGYTMAFERRGEEEQEFDTSMGEGETTSPYQNQHHDLEKTGANLENSTEAVEDMEPGVSPGTVDDMEPGVSPGTVDDMGPGVSPGTVDYMEPGVSSGAVDALESGETPEEVDDVTSGEMRSEEVDLTETDWNYQPYHQATMTLPDPNFEKRERLKSLVDEFCDPKNRKTITDEAFQSLIASFVKKPGEGINKSSSGSRYACQIGDLRRTLHAPHGQDRLCPKAQRERQHIVRDLWEKTASEQ